MKYKNYTQKLILNKSRGEDYDGVGRFSTN